MWSGARSAWRCRSCSPSPRPFYARLPAEERDSIADLDDYRVRAGDSLAVPLKEVAEVTYGTGPDSIERRNGRRIVTVNADVQLG